MLHTAGFPLILTLVNLLRPDPKGHRGLIIQKGLASDSITTISELVTPSACNTLDDTYGPGLNHGEIEQPVGIAQPKLTLPRSTQFDKSL